MRARRRLAFDARDEGRDGAFVSACAGQHAFRIIENLASETQLGRKPTSCTPPRILISIARLTVAAKAAGYPENVNFGELGLHLFPKRSVCSTIHESLPSPPFLFSLCSARSRLKFRLPEGMFCSGWLFPTKLGAYLIFVSIRLVHTCRDCVARFWVRGRVRWHKDGTRRQVRRLSPAEA